MRLLALCLIAIIPLFSMVGLAQAGDFAKRHILGFSPDGGLFAFEEYGRQDGSGFPYANIYVIDTDSDQWTAGSPYRARLDDETKTIFDAREEAKILAGPVLKSFEERGNVVATYRASQSGADTKRMVANPRFVVPPIDEEIEFRLTNITMPASALCEAFGPSVGFKLTQIATSPDQSTRILHQDASVPDSRGCPRDYRLADIITYFPEAGTPKVAVLIHVISQGFEGPDGRFMAITSSLE